MRSFPVLLLQAPPAPDENRIYSAIFEALATPYHPRGFGARKQRPGCSTCCGPFNCVAIIDEIRQVLAGHVAKQRQFLECASTWGNELQISLGGVGTMDAVARHPLHDIGIQAEGEARAIERIAALGKARINP